MPSRIWFHSAYSGSKSSSPKIPGTTTYPSSTNWSFRLAVSVAIADRMVRGIRRRGDASSTAPDRTLASGLHALPAEGTERVRARRRRVLDVHREAEVLERLRVPVDDDPVEV